MQEHLKKVNIARICKISIHDFAAVGDDVWEGGEGVVDPDGGHQRDPVLHAQQPRLGQLHGGHQSSR